MLLPVPSRQSASFRELSTDPGSQPGPHCPLPEKDGECRPGPVRVHGQTRLIWECKWHKLAVPTNRGGWWGVVLSGRGSPDEFCLRGCLGPVSHGLAERTGCYCLAEQAEEASSLKIHVFDSDGPRKATLKIKP